MNKYDVVIMGLGYIGLPTASLIASKKINVLGVDVKPEVIKTINKGKIHIVEPDLEGLVDYVVNKEYLKASTKPEPADVYIITVPTPVREDNQPDISYVESAICSISPSLREGNLFINEPTYSAETYNIQKITYKEKSKIFWYSTLIIPN